MFDLVCSENKNPRGFGIRHQYLSCIPDNNFISIHVPDNLQLLIHLLLLIIRLEIRSIRNTGMFFDHEVFIFLSMNDILVPKSLVILLLLDLLNSGIDVMFLPVDRVKLA